MHIYFSGIGGTGIGPLALVAMQLGYTVSGSDKQPSLYIDYLRQHGINNIHIGQEYATIAAVHATEPIDWFVYSSAVAIEQPNGSEFIFCREQQIHISKRDELLNNILHSQKLELIAIAGTHGKTTATAMTIWALQQIGFPSSYILPAKTSFAEMGHHEPGARYFVYEADEFDRNFLEYKPSLSIIAGIDWDHPDIYPTRQEYYAAFKEFIGNSDHTFIWHSDAKRIALDADTKLTVLKDDDTEIHDQIILPGVVNRLDAWIVAQALHAITSTPLPNIIKVLNRFPGVSRRFEKITDRLYSDYAHTSAKIRGALQLGKEVAGDNLVVVYEGLHNTRQHFIQKDLSHLFDDLKKVYVVPSYLAREDPDLETWSPRDIIDKFSTESQLTASPATLNDSLAIQIKNHLMAGDTVLCLSAGGGGSLDEWLRKTFVTKSS